VDFVHLMIGVRGWLAPILPLPPCVRPSDFRDEIAKRICDLLMDGVSLRSICGLEGMPGRTTVFRWMV
jgi:hypothetical protein